MLIPHSKPLIEGRLLARYDRFIVSVKVGRREIEAHCVNTGRMEGLVKPGCRAWISSVPSDSKRKLRYTLELLEIDGIVIGANTILPNYLAESVVRAGLVPGLKRYRELQREVRYGERSRIDLLLQQGGQQHFVEVKNCHLVYPDQNAYFPDSISTRAAGHLDELVKCISAGDKASVLFVVQRRDGRKVRPSALHDPDFAQAAYRAHALGVKFRAVQFDPSPDHGFTFLGMLPVDLTPYDTAAITPYREALATTSGWIRRGKTRQKGV
ncbi:MAG: DNA/RNA nuclease SfsA [Congregibacter sp.]